MHRLGIRLPLQGRSRHRGGLLIAEKRDTFFPTWTVIWVIVFLALWQLGRASHWLVHLPQSHLVFAAYVSRALCLFILLPALAELAAGQYRRRILLASAAGAIVIFMLTAVVSSATYNNYEGLLAYNTFALIIAAACLGVWLSTEIEKIGHLLPLCIIAAGVDILSVARGPSSVVVKQINEHIQHVAAGIPHNPPLTSYLLLHYPQPGGLNVMIGVGDLAFFAILAGTVIKFGLPKFNIPLVALWGFIAAIVSVITDTGIPALPFIGLGFIITNINRMKLDRIEWVITLAVLLGLMALSILLGLR